MTPIVTPVALGWRGYDLIPTEDLHCVYNNNGNNNNNSNDTDNEKYNDNDNDDNNDKIILMPKLYINQA